MPIKIAGVQFINVVSFGGQIKSAQDGSVVGDRAGQTPTVITLDDKQRFFELTKTINGRVLKKLVPMSNVSGFEPMDEPIPLTAPASSKK